ncbi:MAG: hypothetical protein IPN45_10580 [Actinomycetales bacterium]|nr:hypothetical protein [Actinomycetales bacterium]
MQVQRADGGWQDILPTQLVPDRSKKPSQQDQRTEEKKTGAVVPPPAANNPPSILQGPDQVQNAGGNRSSDRRPSVFDPSTLARLGAMGHQPSRPTLVALGLWYAAVSVLKRRRRSRRRTSGSTADQAAGAWSELVDVARDRRISLPPNGTRPAQARALQTALAGLGATGPGAPDFGPRPRHRRPSLRSHPPGRRRDQSRLGRERRRHRGAARDRPAPRPDSRRLVAAVVAPPAASHRPASGRRRPR